LLALRLLHETTRRGELVTGLVYVEPDKQDFVDLLGIVDEPLATLDVSRTRPGKGALDEIMESFR
jgi:2-oxoglutarate ferredoxin oxidoreductase subunit beta